MQKLFLLTLIFSLLTITLIAEEPHPGLLKLITNVVVKLGNDPVIVNAVKEKNAQNESMDTIKKTDAEWISAKTPTKFMNDLIGNECSQYLQKLTSMKAYYSEIFVMDENGALVGLSDFTSDYWQGDEEKFTASFAGGAGKIFIDEKKYDASTEQETVQVSVPVKDGDKTIGAITVGIVVDAIE